LPGIKKFKEIMLCQATDTRPFPCFQSAKPYPASSSLLSCREISQSQSGNQTTFQKSRQLGTIAPGSTCSSSNILSCHASVHRPRSPLITRTKKPHRKSQPLRSRVRLFKSMTCWPGIDLAARTRRCRPFSRCRRPMARGAQTFSYTSPRGTRSGLGRGTGS